MIRTSESTKFVVTALAEFHKKEVSVPKTADNPFFKSKYADLWTIKFKCDPVLNELGLTIVQFPGISEDGESTLITRLCHTSGEFMEAETRLHLAKDDPQAQGSAITYMRRYAYCAVLGIVADPDDDAEKAMRRAPAKPRPVAQTELVNDEVIPTGFADNEIRREGPPSTLASTKQVSYIRGLLRDGGYAEQDIAVLVNTECPPWPDSLNNLSKSQASKLISVLR